MAQSHACHRCCFRLGPAAGTTGGSSRRPRCPPASSRATAGSRPTKSTSTPSSPVAWRNCWSTRATWCMPARSSPAWTPRTSKRRSSRPRRRCCRRNARSTKRARCRNSKQTQVELAQQQLDRTSYLFERGNSTQELLDQRRQQLNGATAALQCRHGPRRAGRARLERDRA